MVVAKAIHSSFGRFSRGPVIIRLIVVIGKLLCFLTNGINLEEKSAWCCRRHGAIQIFLGSTYFVIHLGPEATANISRGAFLVTQDHATKPLRDISLAKRI
jgi:hypothetical protein